MTQFTKTNTTPVGSETLIQTSKGKTSLIGKSLRKLSLKTKATALAIAIGTLPVLLIGVLSYIAVSRAENARVVESSKNKVLQLSDKVNRFMFERYGDIQTLATSDLLTDPSLKVSIDQKSAYLERFIQIYGVYNNITAINLDGSVQFGNTKSDTPKDFNFKKEKIDYFEEALSKNVAVIGFPRLSKITKKFSLFAAAPIKINGNTSGIIRSRIPIGKIDNVIRDFVPEGDEYYIVGAKSGKIFASNNPNELGLVAKDRFPTLNQLLPSQEPTIQIGESQVLSYVNSRELQGLPNLNWTLIVTTPTKIAFAAQQNLFITIAIGTGVTVVLVSILGVWIANLAIKPIEEAANAVAKIGRGELETRLDLSGEDEMAVLGSNINLMAEQLKLAKEEQSGEFERLELARAQARTEADSFANEQRQAREKLQYRALELLIEVDPIGRGDLTIRAQVTEDEIGTIADSYNAMVGSLRRIVTQVQTVSQQMTDTTTSSEHSVQGLSTEALRQAQEISLALEQVKAMSRSIRTVTASAEQAEAVAKQSTITVKEGDIAMDRTVNGILAIRSTVAETSKKVKRLGESSQKISKVVNLISSFADQTNMLALNAAIEAARAGEGGRGFAVVADQVRALARQSAAASAEIESLVEEIQTGTNEVVTAMETGTEQVVAGTKFVDEARENLTKIAEASAQISTLVAAIAQASSEQSRASDIVASNITDVSSIAMNTSSEANQVSNSFKDLLELAQQLQKSVGQFKV